MSSYDLRSLNLPKLTGGMLKLFTSAVEAQLTNGLLMPGLLENGGIPKLRQMELSEPPTFLPLIQPQVMDRAVDFKADRSNSPEGFPLKTIMDYSTAYQQGSITPLEVAEKVLESIERTREPGTDLRLFIAVYKENVLEQARASMERYKRKKPLSLLDGVPIAVKDEIDMLPYPTTVGTRFLGKEPARQDSTVAARLRAAGALLVGKTNMHEIGINPNGYNDAYGAVKNPYDLSCDTGGSSSGSAACVAAGIVPAAIGADGGGSIRIPASLCGVVGLKSTFGRVSEFGAAPLCWSVAHLGPLSASVEDTALIYSIIAGKDPLDPNTAAQPSITLKDWNKPDLKGLTAGIFKDWFEHADPQVVKTNYDLVEQLKERGLQVKEIDIPDLDGMRISHSITILSEMALCMHPYQDHKKEMGAPVRLNLVIGEGLTSMDYIQAQRMRTRALNYFQKVFESVDFILTPATAWAAQPRLKGSDQAGWTDLSLDIEMMRFVIPGNLLGYPSISFPAGYDSRGLPIGMQAIGRHWQENLLLRIAYNAERVVKRVLPKNYFGD